MRRSILLSTIIILLVLTACVPTTAPATSEPSVQDQSAEEILAEQINATEIISLDYVDMSTADGWPDNGGQDYEIIGATTNQKPPDKPETIIGVLYIREDGYTYPPGIYLVQWLDDTSILLIDQSENTYEAEEVEPMTYEELSLEGGKNYFLFAEGSLRCIKCPWWLFGECYCYRCQ